MNNWTSHEEKHRRQLERNLHNVRKGLVRNSAKIDNWNFVQEEDQVKKEVTLSNNDTAMEAIDILLAALSVI